MNKRLTIDKAGRVILPKPLRDELNLEPGDLLDVESAGEKIILRPVRTPPLTKEQGVWVLRTGQPLSAGVTGKIVKQVRVARDRTNLRKAVR